jgi:hypothetical protein
MILIERQEISWLGGPTALNFLEYNGAVFVNRSSTIEEAIRKIKKHSKEFHTKQSKDQMERVQSAKVVGYNDINELMDNFPEYFI